MVPSQASKIKFILKTNFDCGCCLRNQLRKNLEKTSKNLEKNFKKTSKKLRNKFRTSFRTSKKLRNNFEQVFELQNKLRKNFKHVSNFQANFESPPKIFSGQVLFRRHHQILESSCPDDCMLIYCLHVLGPRLVCKPKFRLLILHATGAQIL